MLPYVVPNPIDKSGITIRERAARLLGGQCAACGGVPDDHIANYYCPEFRAQLQAFPPPVVEENMSNDDDNVISANVRAQEEDDFDDDYYGDCWNCGGEGYIASCFEDYACIDPEGGCGLCMRRCDVCNPRLKNDLNQPRGLSAGEAPCAAAVNQSPKKPAE